MPLWKECKKKHPDFSACLILFMNDLHSANLSICQSNLDAMRVAAGFGQDVFHCTPR